MIVSQSRFEQDFSSAIAENAAAVFVGSGLSTGVGYPDWKTFIGKLRSRLDLPEHHDPLRVAEYAVLKDQGRKALSDLIVHEFARDFNPGKAHLSLASLPLQTIWTTNYDDLLERGFETRGKQLDVKRNTAELGRAPLHARDATLYKMHGDCLDPNNIVLARDDYQTFEHQRPGFLNTFLTHLYEKSFLFVGFGFDDPNLEFLLGRMRSIFGTGQRDHFCLMRGDPTSLQVQLECQYLKRYRINTVVIEKYDEIVGLLENLASKTHHRTRLNSIFISGAVEEDSPEQPRVVQFCEKLVRMLIGEGVTIVSGYGKGIGNSITLAALDSIHHSPKAQFDQLIVRPFPKNSSWDSPEREQHARYMIEHAGFAIILRGYDIEINKSGVWQEYTMAKDLGVLPLPVGALGTIGYLIWEDVVSNIDTIFGSDSALISGRLRSLGDTALADDTHIETLRTLLRDLRHSRRH